MEYRVRVNDADDLARQLLAALAARGEVEPLGGAAGRVLVVGGARSGKSKWAEEQLLDREIDYVATSWLDPADPEWVERVRIHRERRPAHWRTVETIDVAQLLAAPGRPMLVDCLAVWLTRILDGVGAWAETPGWREALAGRVDELVAAVADTGREVLFVSNEVGSGVVPATASGRMFRDELGRLNARIGAACDQVWHVVAGVPRRLK
ncbi:bifunctional adenosylcobinamide kinase/adenosylcobinamide-phosphate guanylyltransferase [Tessaracoccus sp. OH4464_COT-324]|uniref:bifunctional adenosylcobinamide kinase/adenosylcobinamide-phosphate guanylyltransferase n=1 Tax=Tessaracoccus sp. OH4464_COT-324 TaxID=2491059 RepID=UPI001F394346|nr:bifunctional adenosylcobinamide kinase/adenosylcobinamide-phosphate guanylyltransferase [Tessaracoccus sp. OH4464_COT-324]